MLFYNMLYTLSSLYQHIENVFGVNKYINVFM